MQIRLFFFEWPARLFIILFHLFPWDSFPVMLATWPVYRIQLRTCHSAGEHSSRSQRTAMFLKKSRGTRKNGLYSQLYAAEK